MPKPALRLFRAGLTGLSLFAAASARAGTDFDLADSSALKAGNAPVAVAKLSPLDEAKAKAARTAPTTASLWDKRAADGEQMVDNAWNSYLTDAPLPIAPVHRPVFVPEATTATSGYLSTATSVNYSTAPWVITAGDGTYPDLGGVATFNEQIGTTPGTFPAVPTITLDVAVTLSGLTYNSNYEYYLTAGSGGSLSLTTTSANTINVAVAMANSPLITSIGQEIGAPIGGGAAGFGLTKTGSGAVTLEATNTYVGGTTISGGTLFVSTGDAGLGATGTGNDVTLDGGTFGAISTALTTARNFTLTSNGGTIDSFAAATINGVVSGTGNLTFGLGGAALTLTAADTYSGTTTMVGNASLVLSGNGSINQSTAYDFRGTVSLDSSGTYNGNRLNDSAAITVRGVTFSLTGNASTATTETVGAITLNNGLNTFTAAPNSTEPAVLATGGFTRSNNSLLFVRGTGLGGTTGAVNVATITATGIGSSLVGGGGAAGSSTISIIPWAIGNVSTAALGTAANVSSSFVTYDATNGFRPLATTEYATAFGTSTANVRLTAATAAASGVTCNALLFQPSAAAALSGGTINITSGALLYSPSANATGTVSAALNFGTAEGIIVNTSKLTLSSAISGSGGLTLGSPSATSLTTSTITLSGASSFTGNTTIDSGTVIFSGTVAANGTNGVFGSNGNIVLNAGVQPVFLEANAVTALNRNVSILGTGTNYIGTSGAVTFTLSNNVSLSNNVYIYGYSNATGSAITFGGTVSGAGGIYDTGTGYVVLNGSNTYSGGTTIGASSGSSTYVAGSDTAFGTGTISFAATTSTSTLSGGSAARTLANNLLLGAATNTFAGTAALTLTGTVNLNGSSSENTSGTITGAATVNITNSSTAGVTFGGQVSNGAIAKTGAGVLTLSNASGNNYTGGTTVSGAGGSLLVTNTSGSGTGSGAIRVTSGTLGGTGFIVNTIPSGSTTATTSLASGAIIQGGTGAATGALTLNGNLTLVSGSIIELGLDANGNASSLTRSGGTWTLPSGIKFTFTGSPTIGQTYDNLLTGLAADPGTESGWTVTNNGFSGTFIYDGAGDIDLTMTTVPEPATLLGGALTAGLFGWGLRRRLRAVKM